MVTEIPRGMNTRRIQRRRLLVTRDAPAWVIHPQTRAIALTFDDGFDPSSNSRRYYMLPMGITCTCVLVSKQGILTPQTEIDLVSANHLVPRCTSLRHSLPTAWTSRTAVSQAPTNASSVLHQCQVKALLPEYTQG